MVGGPKSYGAGGYQKTPLEETLPVDMGVRDRQKQPDVALVVVIDQSGSMAACHCNTFNGGMGGGSGIGGVQKVDIGKEAILRAAAALTERDELGVVGFNEAAHWVVRTQPLGGIGDLQGQIAGIRADGQTNIFAGLDQAVTSLEGATATRRHIILLTDGWSTSGQYDAILAKMKADGITLSTVGAGGGANPFLEQLAKQGGGRFYAATNPTSIPDIFLKETQQVSGQQIVEEPFFPIQTSSLADPARAGRRPAAAPRLQRDDDQAGRPERAGHGARRSAPRVVAVRARAVRGLDVGLDRALGEGLGRLERLQPVLQPARSAGPSRARRPAASRRPSRRPAATTALHVESVERRRLAARLLRDERERRRAGPRARDRRTSSRSRPGSTRRRSARSTRARTRSGSPRRGRGRRRSGGRSGWSPRPRPSTGSSAPTSRSSRRCGRRPAGRSSRRATDPWVHDLTATDRFTDLWPLLLVLALLLWPLDIALRRMSLGRRELAAARGWVARDRATAPGRRTADRHGRGAARGERSRPDERCAGGDADATPAASSAAPRRPRRDQPAAGAPRRSDPSSRSAPPAADAARQPPPAPAATAPPPPRRRGPRHDGPPPRRQASRARPLSRVAARIAPDGACAAGGSLRLDVLPRRSARPRVRPVALVVAACSFVETTPPAPTPADFPDIGDRVRPSAACIIDNVVSGDAGCDDQVLAPTAIAFDASGLDQATTVKVYLYVFRNRATFERLRATIDACARTFVTDPETYESIEQSPFVLVGQGPWGTEVRGGPAGRRWRSRPATGG